MRITSFWRAQKGRGQNRGALRAPFALPNYKSCSRLWSGNHAQPVRLDRNQNIVYCLGCGEDVVRYPPIDPKERRNIGRESYAASEPRERVLSLWAILLKQEFEDLDFCFENNYNYFIGPLILLHA